MSHTYGKHSGSVGNFMQVYCMPGDTITAGAWLGRIMGLWALTLGIIEFCQWIYAAQWALLVTIVTTWIQFSLGFIFLIVLIWFSIWTSADARSLANVGSEDGVKRRNLYKAKRSRYNAAVDVAFISFYFFLSIFAVANVMCYWLGTPITFLHGATQTINRDTVNYPLTNATAFPAMTAAVIQQVNYRSYVHLLNWLFDFFALALLATGRMTAVLLIEAGSRSDQDGNGDRNGSVRDGRHATYLGERQDTDQIELQGVQTPLVQSTPQPFLFMGNKA